MNIKSNTKQWVVAGVILVTAILMLMLGFSGKETKAPEKTTPPQVEQPVAKPEPVAAEPVAPKVEEAEPKIEEAPAVAEPAPKAEEKPAEPEKEVIKVEPKNAVLMFTATAEKDFNYEVYYTVEREVWYDAEHVVAEEGKTGTHNYSIVLPEKAVYRIRLDFGSAPGTVTIKNIRLEGSQKADLNDIANCEINQIDKLTENEDGSITVTSAQEDPYIAYRTPLLPE